MNVDALERNPVAGLKDLALSLGLLDVGLVGGRHLRAADFDRLAVIQVHVDGNELRQGGHGANVIAVEVRGEQEIDLLQAGLLRRGEDPLGVAIVRRAIGGVDQQGLTAGRDDQSGGAAFGVNPVDLQIARCGKQCARAEQSQYDKRFGIDQ